MDTPQTVETQLEQAKKELETIRKTQDDFVYKVSHELRTPITAIKGSLSTILEGYTGELPLAARDILLTAYNENDRLMRLVDNLLALSRIEGGRFVYAIKNVNVDQVFMDTVESMKSAAKEKDLFLKYDANEKLPLVSADEDKVKEVIINLIGNAIKYTQKGGVTVSGTVRGDQVVISVTDTGLGIGKEDQALLFQKYSQVQALHTQQPGAGLGLYISKQIIEGHKGKIWVESSVGIGSTFFFSLPIAH